MDQRHFYICLDTEMLIDMMVTEMQYLVSTWKAPGRPLLIMPIHCGMLSEFEHVWKLLLLLLKYWDVA